MYSPRMYFLGVVYTTKHGTDQNLSYHMLFTLPSMYQNCPRHLIKKRMKNMFFPDYFLVQDYKENTGSEIICNVKCT